MRSPRPLILVLALSLAGCSRSSEQAPTSSISGALARQEPTRVRVLPAERQETVRALETTTVVESERRVVIQARIAGELVELFVEEGDEVEAGALLARLDQRDTLAMVRDSEVALKEAQDAAAKGLIARREAEGAIEQCRLAFEQAKRNYERNEAARLISAQDLEKLKLEMETADAELEAKILAKDRAEIEGRAAATAVDRAQLAVERAQIALSHTELRAPFAGVIADRKCQVGDSITAADEAFTLTDLSNLRTVFYRPQRELALFSGLTTPRGEGGLEGIEVTAESEALPGYTFTGRIERISPEIESASGSFRVTVGLDPMSDGVMLLPGMLLRVRLVVERHPDSLVVSKRALRREGDSTVLFVVREGRARRVVVEERFSADDVVEVAVLGEEPLEEGDLVVVVGNRDLEDDKEVVVTVEEAEPGTSPEAEAEIRTESEPEAETEAQESGADSTTPTQPASSAWLGAERVAPSVEESPSEEATEAEADEAPQPQPAETQAPETPEAPTEESTP